MPERHWLHSPHRSHYPKNENFLFSAEIRVYGPFRIIARNIPKSKISSAIYLIKRNISKSEITPVSKLPHLDVYRYAIAPNT